MKTLSALLAVLALIGALGCKKDPNQNLKPIDPNTPPPSKATLPPGGDKPVSVPK